VLAPRSNLRGRGKLGERVTRLPRDRACRVKGHELALPVPSGAEGSLPKGPLATAFLIGNKVTIEFAATCSKQTRGTNPNR
jgi:hypothetical protein